MAAKTRIVQAPAPRIIRIREGGKKAKNLAKRGVSKAAQIARDEMHTLVAVGAAGAFGYARREDMLANIPKIEAIGAEGTYALVAFAAGKFLKSKVASHVATGLACVAVNRMAAGDDDAATGT